MRQPHMIHILKCRPWNLKVRMVRAPYLICCVAVHLKTSGRVCIACVCFKAHLLALSDWHLSKNMVTRLSTAQPSRITFKCFMSSYIPIGYLEASSPFFWVECYCINSKPFWKALFYQFGHHRIFRNRKPNMFEATIQSHQLCHLCLLSMAVTIHANFGCWKHVQTGCSLRPQFCLALLLGTA